MHDRGDAAEDGADVGHDQLVGVDVGEVALYQERRGAGRDGGGGEVVAVGERTGACGEQHAGACLAAVVGDVGDRLLADAVQHGVGEQGGQVGQCRVRGHGRGGAAGSGSRARPSAAR